MKSSFDTLKKRLIFGLLVVAGPVFLVSGTRDYLRHRQLLSSGVTAEATVIGSQLERGRRGADRYRLDLRYDLPASAGGVTQQSAALYVSPKQYAQLGGDRVAIRYLPDEPSRPTLAAGSSNSVMGILLGLAMTAAGWIPLVLAIRRRMGKDTKANVGSAAPAQTA